MNTVLLNEETVKEVLELLKNDGNYDMITAIETDMTQHKIVDGIELSDKDIHSVYELQCYLNGKQSDAKVYLTIPAGTLRFRTDGNADSDYVFLSPEPHDLKHVHNQTCVDHGLAENTGSEQQQSYKSTCNEMFACLRAIHEIDILLARCGCASVYKLTAARETMIEAMVESGLGHLAEYEV